MEKNPKKSKALIITFIVVLVLLILGYFLFTNQEKVFGTKGTFSISKIFESLIGTNKQKDLNTINNGSPTNTNTGPNTNNNPANPNNTNTNTGNNNTTTGPNANNTNTNTPNGPVSNPNSPITTTTTGPTSTLPPTCQDTNASNFGGSLPCSYPIVIPNANLCNDSTATNYQGPLPCTYPSTNTSIKQCGDSKDNDGDGLVDGADPSCHTDFDFKNVLSYDSKINDESKGQTTINPETNICLDDPLVYTVEEKAKMALLIRKFYLIAPTLKSDDDISLVKNETSQNKALIQQSNELIQACMSEKANPSYTGPQTIFGNPYFNSSQVGHYFTSNWELNVLENMFYIW